MFNTAAPMHSIIVRNHLLPHIGKVPLTQLRPEHVRMMLNRIRTSGCGDRTRQHARNVLSAALREALRLEYVSRNVARLVDPPKYVAPERKVWTKEQVTHFLESIKGHERYPMFLLLLCCGLRRGELLGLRWNDVDFENNVIRIRQSLCFLNGKPHIGPPKTRASRRDLPLLPAVREALSRYGETTVRYDDGLIFHSSKGNPVCPSILQRTFHRLAQKANLPPLSIHEARHTAATLLAETWASPKEAQTILGHSSITTTLQIYTHSRLQREASALGALLQSVLQ